MEVFKNLETAVIVLNYNGKKLLEELIPITIANTSIDSKTQLIIADNASTDDSLDWLKENYPDLPLMVFKTNHGFAGGYWDDNSPCCVFAVGLSAIAS